MSYDVGIGAYSGNYTSNTSSVFYDHMEGGLKSLDGLTGKQALERLELFWRRVNKSRNEFWQSHAVGEPEFQRKYDSPNGWGSLVGTLIFAGEITAACALHPRHRVYVGY